MPLGLALLIALIDATRSRAAAALTAWAFAFGQFLLSFAWIAESFTRQDEVPAGFAPIAVAALAAGMAVYYGLTFAAVRAFWDGPVKRMLLASLAYGLAEWIRGWAFTGFPWNPVAAIWGFSDAMLQPLAVLGTWSWGLMTLLGCFSLACLWGPKRVPAFALLALAVPLAGFSYGLARLPDGAVDTVPDLTLRLVQPNISQRDKWRPELRGRHLADYLALTQRRPDGSKGRWVAIWSETAVPYLLAEDAIRRALVADALPDNGVLITGQFRRDEPTDQRFYNSLLVIGAGGDVLAAYDKAHLVPFGEYVPLADRLGFAKPLFGVLGLASFIDSGGTLKTGPGLRTVSAANLPPFSPLICYEAIFPGEVVAAGAPRPAWLVNVTNDAWFGSSEGPHQHLVLARMRTVEEGLPMARVAGTGISAVIDPYGRVTHKAELLHRKAFNAPLPRAITPPPYARWRNGLFWLSLLIFAALCFTSRLLRVS